MADSLSVVLRGLPPPARRASRCGVLQHGLALLVVACGGSAGHDARDTLAAPATPTPPTTSSGDVEPVCIEHYLPSGDVPINTQTGQPALQPRRDVSWSSPYCAQFAH